MKLTENVKLVEELVKKICIYTEHLMHHKYDEEGIFSHFDYNITTEGDAIVVKLSAPGLKDGHLIARKTFTDQVHAISDAVGYDLDVSYDLAPKSVKAYVRLAR